MLEFIKKLMGKIEPDKSYNDYENSPKTFEEAVDFVTERINPDTVSNVHFHHTGGMSVRNNLGLWDKSSPLYKHMQERFGLCHADDTGALITSAAHAKKNGLEYSPDADIAVFKAHWRRLGYDPATMNVIPKEPDDVSTFI